MVPRADPRHHPKRHLDRFSWFCVGHKCSAVQHIVNGEENPQNCPFFLRFSHPARGAPSHSGRQRWESRRSEGRTWVWTVDGHLDSTSVVGQFVGRLGVVGDDERSLSQSLTESGLTRADRYRRLTTSASSWSNLRPVLRTYKPRSILLYLN